MICVLWRTPLPRDRAIWGHAAVVALLANTVPFVLLAYGEQHVDSVLAGLLNATTPLMTLLFVPLLVPTERITGRRVAGLLIGFAGVLCVLGVWRGVAGSTVTGVLACLGSTASYGATFAYMQRFFAGRSGSAPALSAAQLVCASVELAVVAPVLAGLPHWPGGPAAVALLALGALGVRAQPRGRPGRGTDRRLDGHLRHPGVVDGHRGRAAGRTGGLEHGCRGCRGGCRGRHHPPPRPSLRVVALPGPRRGHAPVSFGAPCRALVAPDVIVRA